MLKNPDYSINTDRIPYCPKSPDLPMKLGWMTKTKVGLTRYKFVCPQAKWFYNPAIQQSHRECKCKKSVYILHL
jgi:hypothetical protein